MTEQTNDQSGDEALVPGSPEYNDAMASKFREAKDSKTGDYPPLDDEQDEEDKPSAPEGIPAKFIREDGSVDVEAMAKSYTELEKMRGPQKPADSDEGKTGDNPPDGDEAAADVAAEAGLSYDALVAKVQEKGDLDAEDYAAFKKAGIPEEAVREYIELRNAEVARSRQTAIDYIGGEQETQELMSWAAANLSEQEIDGYNQMLSTPQWKAAVDTLKNLRGNSKATAGEPKLRSAAGSSSGSSTGYASRDEMRADMANPLYHKAGPEGDKFRADVQRKMAYAAWRRS